MSELQNGVMIAKLEKRVSKTKGTEYFCINVYAKDKNGNIELVSNKGNIYVDADKKDILEIKFGITPVDLTK